MPEQLDDSEGVRAGPRVARGGALVEGVDEGGDRPGHVCAERAAELEIAQGPAPVPNEPVPVGQTDRLVGPQCVFKTPG